MMDSMARFAVILLSFCSCCVVSFKTINHRCSRMVLNDQSDFMVENSLFYSKKSFADIGMPSKLVEVAKSLGLTKPSKIQAISFARVLSGKSCVLTDQTGSGKTFAYLLPTIHRMQKLIAAGKLSEVSSRQPYIMIITPTSELANQVAKVVKQLANAMKFRTACLTSTSDIDVESKKLRLGAEVLVCTPGILISMMKKKSLSLEKLQVAVLDEADILFMDHSFPMQPIGNSCPDETQFVFTTATLPESVFSQIKAEFPDVELLKGPGFHRIAPNVEEVLIDCSGPKVQQRNSNAVFENKRSAFLKALATSESDRILVFCNTIEQCRRVENILQRDDRSEKLRTVFPYHSAIDATVREDNMLKFSGKSGDSSNKQSVMISTDRASRGMDFFSSNVDHVILFDFPQEPSEYVRRVGRTGRAGRSGKATVLVYGRQVEVAKAVIGASLDGKRIDPE